MQLPPEISIRLCRGLRCHLHRHDLRPPDQEWHAGPEFVATTFKCFHEFLIAEHEDKSAANFNDVSRPYCAQHIFRHGKKINGVAVFDTTIVDKDTIEDDDFAFIEG
jgi:hypothetical protein